MNKKIFIVIISFFLIFLSKVNSLLCLENVEQESINILVDDTYLELSYNTVVIKSQYYEITTFFSSYSLEKSAISKNLILLQCDNQNVKHLSIDLKERSIKCLISLKNKNYFSEISFDNIEYLRNLDSEIEILKLFKTSDLTYDVDLQKYKILEDSVYIVYAYFKSLEYENNKINEYMPRTYTYTFTGDTSDEVEDGYEMINEVFLPPLLYTPGLYYDSVSNDNGLKYIYIVETEQISENQYISKVKVWETVFDATNTIYSSSDVNVDLNITKLYDAFIVGNATSGDITFADEGYTYIPIKSILSKMSVSDYAYISKYRISCKSDEISMPSYFQDISNIIGTFSSIYERVASTIETTNNIIDHANQISFNSYLSQFEFTSDEENLKEVGFAVSDYDLGTGIFNDEYLHNYSFYQDATISLVPTYSIYVDMEIEIVPLYNQNITCCYYSTLEISNNYNCNHVITYEDGEGNVHIVSCDLCGYYYYEDHDSYCINQGEVGHNLCCAYCDNYLLEPHSLRISNGGNQCINCSYFEQTTISYISNNDGVTHRIQSGTITETDFCFGLVASDGNVYCVMCGQNMSDFVLNSVMHPYDDLLIE